jgi:hypothetical protein
LAPIVAVGWQALESNTIASANTAIGYQALHSFTTGPIGFERFGLCTVVGFRTLAHANGGFANSAFGYQALANNTCGSGNTANGQAALSSNTTGVNNTANGAQALHFNTTGQSNTADGINALVENTSGTDNTAVGRSALGANSSGNNNTALGAFAGVVVTTADNVICIGHTGANVHDSCFIGNIRGVTTGAADAIPVVIDSVGQLGTMSSSRRFKSQIEPMDKASEAIMALKPVTFHYKSDTMNRPQFGLIAEEVAEVNPDLVVRDDEDQVYTVRYDVAQRILKEHRRVEELKSAIAQERKDFEAAIVQQQKTTEALVARLNEQEARIQKVSAQIEMAKSKSQMLVENR